MFPASCFALAQTAHAQVTTQFTVSGNVTAPETFNLSTLQALTPTTDTNVTYLQGSTPVGPNSFTGPQFWTLLTSVGIRQSSVKNDILDNVVVAIGSDAYTQVFSTGELNPSFGGSATSPDLVAYATNGGSLGSNGFARTVVPGDGKGGRYVSNLNAIDVIHAPTQTGTFSGGLSTQFTVTGYVNSAQTFNLASLQTLAANQAGGATTVTISGGTTYTGALLWNVLGAAGITTNPLVKNNLERDYVVATGSDGYQTVVSLGEIDPAFGNQQDIIAYATNGGAAGTSLGSNGDFRLITPNDVSHGRYVSNLVNLEVFDTTQWVANAGELTDLSGLTFNAYGFTLNGGELASSTGPGTLILSSPYVSATTPIVVLNGGQIDASVTVSTPNPITQLSGTSYILGSLIGPSIAVNGGTLQLVGGALTGAVNVASGATLGGTGTLTGALTFASGSFYSAMVTQTGADHLAVTGAASLAGTLQITAVNGGGAPGSRYALLSATGGLTGTFSTASLNAFPNWLTPTLSYTTNAVDLYLAPKTLSSLIPGPLPQNKSNVVAAINAGLLTAMAPQGFLNLFNLPGAALPTVLGQLTGEAATGAQTVSFHAGSNFLNLLLDPAARLGDAGISAAPALAYAEGPVGSAGGAAIAQAVGGTAQPVAMPPGWSIWGSAFGGYGATSGSAALGSSRLANNAEGLIIGADYRADPSFVVGFGIAGGATAFQLANALGSGTGSLFQAGLFASKSFGAFYVSAAAAYTRNETQVDRTVGIPGIYEVLQSNPLGQAGGGRVELGYRLPAFPITPYVAAEAQHYGSSGVTESAVVGTPVFGLTYAPVSAGSVRSEIGLRSQIAYATTPDMTLILSGRVAWTHEYDRTRAASAYFETLAVAPFTVNGAGEAPNAARLTAGAELRMSNGFSVFANADGDVAPQAYALRGKVGLRYTW